ncbi:SDR family NAD(P)-dependent oxidoreductase [Chryseobacterium sp. A301]
MKTIFITGASSGIGKAVATYFAQMKHRLILCGRREEKLHELQKQFSECEVHVLVFDVRDRESVQKAVDSIPVAFRKIDVLVNNAGNAHGIDSLLTANLDDWDAMLDGNVKGLLYVSKAILPLLTEKGHIVNVSSVAARQTYAGGVVYCASKRAVDVISEGMRLELTQMGIKVTNIQPGAVETEFSDVRFKGDRERASKVYQGFQALKAEDVADAIGYCVEAPAHVTISDLTIYPSAQSEPRTIHKNE